MYTYNMILDILAQDKFFSPFPLAETHGYHSSCKSHIKTF